MPHVFKDKEFILNSYIVQDYINQFYDFEQIYTDAAKKYSGRGIQFSRIKDKGWKKAQ